MTGATGPKISSRANSKSFVTPANTCGGNTRPDGLPPSAATLRWLPGGLSPVIPERLRILQRIFRGIHGKISLAAFVDDVDGAERDGDILFTDSEEPSDRDYEGIDLSGR